MSKQRSGLAVAVIAFTLALWTINFGLIDLTDGLTGYVDQERNAVLDVGWGAVFGIVVPLGLLAQLRHPERRIAGLQQTALVAVALAVAGISGRAWGYLWLAAGTAAMLGLLLALHPARRDFLRRGGRTRPLLALAGAVAAVPCVLYANRTASAQRHHEPPSDAVTNGLHHWTVMCALALVVVLLTALAALGTRDWRIPAWSAALAAVAWSVSCLRYPTDAGSEGRTWALAVLAWAFAVAAATHLEGRRDRARSVRTHIREEPARDHRRADPATIRTVIYAAAGILGVVRGVIGYSNPTYWAASTRLDWVAVITMSGFLTATAVSLVLLSANRRGFSRWPLKAAAAGAAVAGAANALEDGLGVRMFGYPFAAGTALMLVGLLAGGLALTISRRGPRPLGLLLLANVAALVLAFDDAGLILVGSTWLVIAGLLSLRAAGAAPPRSRVELSSAG